jgi:maleylacetoacetate isomerase
MLITHRKYVSYQAQNNRNKQKGRPFPTALDKMDNATFHLYSYFRSTCSTRVRTAAALKGIPLTFSFKHLLKGEQLSDEYATINPSRTVPTLTITYKTPQGEQKTTQVRQSVAILELLEEMFPDQCPLLPSKEDIVGRAHVRDLVNIIACDVQPPTNLRILMRVGELGGDGPTWAKDLMQRGFQAFEQLATPSAGKYTYGDQLTLADVVLAPAVENAIRYNIDLGQFPTVHRVYLTIRELEAFKKGDWKHQDDTPEEFRPTT